MSRQPPGSGARPQAVVIAGPNGAGKTSAAPDLLRDAVGIDVFVNAYAIAEGLAAFDPASAAIAAGRIMLRRLDELARTGTDLAFESTLAGRGIRRRIMGLNARGYDLHIFYLWLPSPEMAVARVRSRVATGGHGVPEGVIRRRFWRSLVNFDAVCRPIATVWRMYDGSVVGERPVIARGHSRGEPSVHDERKWAIIQEQIAEHSS